MIFLVVSAVDNVVPQSVIGAFVMIGIFVMVFVKWFLDFIWKGG
jgi:hypothetical protein